MFFAQNGAAQEAPANTEFTRDEQELVMEACLMDLGNEGLTAFLENVGEVQAAIDEEVVMEKTIVKLDKNAKLNRAYWAAIFNIAGRKKDPKMKKLRTLWKMEAKLERDLEKQYGNEARRNAKKMVKNLKTSSKTVAKAAKEANKQFNAPTAKPSKNEKI